MLSAPDAAQDAAVDALERAGHPVVRIAVDDPYDLGEEFFRWEIATAVAGSILGIHPFDQPDVEASKIATRKLTAEYEKTGTLPAETPIFTADGIKLFTDEKNAAALARMVNGDPTLAGYLKAHLSRLGAGDYFALLAYIEMNEAHERALQAMRHARPRRQARRDVPRVRTALPALDGAGLQGWAEHGRVPADHLRRRRRRARAGTEIHVRRGQGGPGARGFPGPGGARPPRAARSSRRRTSLPASRHCKRPSWQRWNNGLLERFRKTYQFVLYSRAP